MWLPASPGPAKVSVGRRHGGHLIGVVMLTGVGFKLSTIITGAAHAMAGGVGAWLPAALVAPGLIGGLLGLAPARPVLMTQLARWRLLRPAAASLNSSPNG